MKRTAILLLVVAAFLLIGCLDKASDTDKIEFGEAFWLKPGQSVEFPERRFLLRFDSVSYDDRCPSDPNVYCFWEGRAGIEITLDMGETATAIDLAIPGYVTGNDTAHHIPVVQSGYRFILRQLDPMPSLNDTVAPDYRALIEVDLADAQPEGELSPVQIVDETPSTIQVAPFGLDSVSVSNDILKLKLSYSGGCAQHYFVMFMTPPSFMESAPVQANLFLRHIDNNDVCDGFWQETEHFDLTPIAELYQSMYGRLDPIILNVHEYFGGDSTRVVRVQYDPTE